MVDRRLRNDRGETLGQSNYRAALLKAELSALDANATEKHLEERNLTTRRQ